MYVEYKGTKHCDDNVFNELISIPEWMFDEPIETDNIDVEDDNDNDDDDETKVNSDTISSTTTCKTTLSFSNDISKNDDNDNTVTISETSSDIIIDREMTLTEDSKTYEAEAGILTVL